jgi:hypothetical protein
MHLTRHKNAAAVLVMVAVVVFGTGPLGYGIPRIVPGGRSTAGASPCPYHAVACRK